MFFSSMMMGGGNVFNIIIDSLTTDFNLRTKLNTFGFNNNSPSIIDFKLNSGVTIGASTGTAKSWQTGTLATHHTVTITIEGTISGGGGADGAGGTTQTGSCQDPGEDGVDGTDAMSFEASGPTYNVILASTATLNSGGGGGGGGGGFKGDTGGNEDGGDGGRGQGYDQSATNGQNVGPYAGAGGNGGAFGVDGEDGGDGECPNGSGGASGYAIRKNSNTVNVTDNGATINGTVG